MEMNVVIVVLYLALSALGYISAYRAGERAERRRTNQAELDRRYAAYVARLDERKTKEEQS